MPKNDIFEGDSVDEAIEKAVEELTVSKEDLDVEILAKPSKGLLGIGVSKGAKIKVAFKKVGLKDEGGKSPKVVTEELLSLMGIEAEVDFEDLEDSIAVDVSGDNLGMLIGRHGHTLDAFQYLVNIMVNKDKLERKRVIVDIEGYRKQKTGEIKAMAERVVGKVMVRQKPITLRPMNAYERRLVHTIVGEYSGVSSTSIGEDPERKVVISPDNN